ERPVVAGDASTSVHTVETGAWSLSLASQVAAFAVSLPDHVAHGDPRWSALATAFAERGGPDAWLAVARAMQEVALRQPHAQEAARAVAAGVQAKAIGVRASSADNERAERAEAITVRLVHPEAPRAPQALIAELAHAVGQWPAAPEARALIDDCGAELDAIISRAVRSLAREDVRDAAQGSLTLEEVVDLVVDGDLEVIAHHLGEVAARAAALALVDALRDRLLKMVWSGLRRSAPAAAVWRRWLLRSATVLPRVPPTNRHVAAETVRDQVLETLERVAEDPLVGQRALERHVAAALVELAAALVPTLGHGAIGAVMTWMALRGVMGPTQVRLRRWIVDDEAGDRVQGWFRLVELMTRSGRDAAQDLASLQSMVGDHCRLGRTLGELVACCNSLVGRRPEDHWSGLPRFDLTDFARVADALGRLAADATFALTLDHERPAPAARTGRTAVTSLTERAAQLDRLLTSTSLKFVDAARRTEVVEHYLGELGALCEAIATGCGPLLSSLVRSALARAMVAVRAMAASAVRTETMGARHIGRLRVLGELSSAHEGGMASTFLAEGPAPGKRVVVKLLPWAGMRGTSAETARALFEGEMERLARVVHPNIVGIVDAGFVDEGAYIALEYIPGASLETLLTRLGRMTPAALAPIVRDVARALAHLHERGVLHRDVKPANLLAQFELPDGVELTAETLARAELIRAVLIDFGIATETSRAGAHEGITGTPGYIAPEVVRGIEPFGPAVDVYALAVVVFEMLCGANPFLAGEPDLETVLVRHGSVSLPWSELADFEGRGPLVKLLQDATRMDPRHRPSMRAFLQRWTALSAGF
ncbi:MAG: putative serine/threonine protein kinase, partial [Myxococcaceae bacterium]|nr:putative serine/threonine protein kinase [Myxococcaceae bacterium]